MANEKKTRYNDFNAFLEDVVETAKKRSDILREVYVIENLVVLQILTQILKYLGFGTLAVIGASLSLGLLGFSVQIPIFLGNPFGIAAFAFFGAATVPALWKLYRDRKIAIAVVDLGKKLKKPYKMLIRTGASKEYFDRMHKEAVVALLIDPKEFYKFKRDYEYIERMYKIYFFV